MLCPAFPITSGMSGFARWMRKKYAALVLGAIEPHALGLEHDAAEEVAQECFVCTHVKTIPRYRAVRS